MAKTAKEDQRQTRGSESRETLPERELTDSDTEREGVDLDDGDNVGPAAVRDPGLALIRSVDPAEEGEDRRERVDTEDGADELPRGPGTSAALQVRRISTAGRLKGQGNAQ